MDFQISLDGNTWTAKPVSAAARAWVILTLRVLELKTDGDPALMRKLIEINGFEHEHITTLGTVVETHGRGQF